MEEKTKEFNWDTFLMLEKASKDTIDFKKVYVDMVGDQHAGLLLSQIIYWYLPDKNGKTKLRVEKNNKLWLAKKASDWWEEIRLNARQATYALKKIEKCGLIEKKVFKFNGEPTTHIRLLTENFITNYITRNEQLYHGFVGELTKLSKPIDKIVISSNIDYRTENTKNDNGFLGSSADDPKKTNHTLIQDRTTNKNDIHGGTHRKDKPTLISEPDLVQCGESVQRGKSVKPEGGSITRETVDLWGVQDSADLAHRLADVGIIGAIGASHLDIIFYYITQYSSWLQKPHPNLEKDQLLRVTANLYCEDDDVAVVEAIEDWKAIIDHWFRCDPVETDYNILHFANPTIIKNRYYECLYDICEGCQPF